MTALHPPVFYPGLHQPSDAKHFDRACISIHRLLTRKKPLGCPEVMVDSGAFTKLDKYGRYPEPVEVYALQLYRLWTEGVVAIAVAAAQDYMCEPFMLEKTGLTVLEHQRLTIERYDDLTLALDLLFDGDVPFPLMPVLQGFEVEDYLHHIEMYGDRLKPGMLIGVGSVCKRQGDPEVIEELLFAIKAALPEGCRLHGFGVKSTSLTSPLVCALLDTADSMAWSFAARYEGRDPNDWREAKAFADRISARTQTTDGSGSRR